MDLYLSKYSCRTDSQPRTAMSINFNYFVIYKMFLKTTCLKEQLCFENETS